MKALYRVLCLFLLLASCTISETPIPPKPTITMAQGSGENLATLQRGHALFLSHCGRCHEPQMPASVSAADWHVVVPGMAWNAGLAKADEAAILKYLLAAQQITE